MITPLYPVVILAGGLATRLRPLTETIPKAMIEVNGKPFIEHQLRLLAKQGIQQVIICLNYLGEQIVEYIGNGNRFNLQISCVYDGPQLLGTAGAIKQALHLLPEHFFVMYGDSYLPCHFLNVQESFIQQQKLGLMTVFFNQNRWDNSNIEFSKGEIVCYDKKNRTPRMHYIDYGLGILSKQCFDTIPMNEAYDLATLYQNLLAQKQLAAYEVADRFYENGSFAGITALEEYLSQPI